MKDKPHPALLAWPGLFWIAVFAVPLILVVLQVTVRNESSLLFNDLPYFRQIFLFTISQATLSTVFCLILGLPGAALLALYRFPGRRVLKALSTVPFVLPPILVVLGFVLVFGNNGVINGIRSLVVGQDSEPWQFLYSFRAIIMAHVFYNFPITLRIVGDAWEVLDPEPGRAARSSGSGPLRCFFLIDLPRLIPSVLSAALLTFVFCFMSFAVVLVLGGRPELVTLEVEIYRLVNHQLDFTRGSFLALGSFLFIFTMIALVFWAGTRFSEGTVGRGVLPIKKPLKGFPLIVGLLYLVVALLLVLGPLLAVTMGSFLLRSTRSATPVLSLNHWYSLTDPSFQPYQSHLSFAPVYRSLALGACSSLIAVSTASLAAWYSTRARRIMARVIDSLMAFPLALSSVVLGMGYLLLSSMIFPGASGSTGRIWALLLVHSSLALPFAYRVISLRLASIPDRIRQSSRSLGAGSLRHFFFIELPLMRRAILTAMLFSMALSAGETNAALVLAPGGFTTIPLAIYRLISTYRVFSACVLGTVLIGICTLTFFLLDSESGRDFKKDFRKDFQ